MAKYKRHYLTSVIVRVDFAEPPGDIDARLPSGLSAAIKKKFPVPATPVERVERKVALNVNTGELENLPTVRYYRWDFHAKDMKRYVRIERDFFLIDYATKYRSSGALKKDFVWLVAEIGKAFPDVKFGRLGLRYIDTFPALGKSNPLDWQGWIRPDRVAILKVPGDAERPFIVRGMQEVELVYDDMRTRHRFGMPNPDYPSRIKRKQFVLDSDAFYERAFEADEVPAMLKECQDKVGQFFEDSITEKMRRHLNAPKGR